MAEWSATRSQHWDTVARWGSSPRAAVIRQYKLEMVTIQGFSRAEVLWDDDKFYDHARLRQVAHVAQGVGHPLPALALGLDAHQAPRRLRAEGAVSKVICPDHSLIAGGNQSVDVAKLSGWQVLESMHADCRPLGLINAVR